jgi:REP element-mobilizing transposase RayT
MVFQASLQDSRMVIAHHLIWTGYGWWPPNDIRGSGSKVIRNDFLAELGALHYGRKRVQPAGWEVRAFQARAAERLRFQVVTFNAMMIACIARAFAMTIQQIGYTCYACAIMPDHVHLIIRKHRHLAEEMIRNLQRDSHLLLRQEGFFDLDHPIWGGQGWKVFLDQPNDVWRTIDYVWENPLKIKLPPQEWEFVTPYNNWPFHKRS